MFAPISAPSYIQTVHGLTYRVAPVSQRDENEDPQSSREGRRPIVQRELNAKKRQQDERQ